MNRTTRSVTLTGEGQAFLPHAQAALEAAEAGRAALASGREEAAGLLRVTAPANSAARWSPRWCRPCWPRTRCCGWNCC